MRAQLDYFFLKSFHIKGLFAIQGCSGGWRVGVGVRVEVLR